jgi:hypothetical protein
MKKRTILNDERKFDFERNPYCDALTDGGQIVTY